MSHQLLEIRELAVTFFKGKIADGRGTLAIFSLSLSASFSL